MSSGPLTQHLVIVITAGGKGMLGCRGCGTTLTFTCGSPRAAVMTHHPDCTEIRAAGPGA